MPTLGLFDPAIFDTAIFDTGGIPIKPLTPVITYVLIQSVTVMEK